MFDYSYDSAPGYIGERILAFALGALGMMQIAAGFYLLVAGTAASSAVAKPDTFPAITALATTVGLAIALTPIVGGLIFLAAAVVIWLLIDCAQHLHQIRHDGFESALALQAQRAGSDPKVLRELTSIR